MPEVLVELIHDNSVRVDGELFEEFEVTNALRQGCTMVPTSFKLYACIVADKRVEIVKEVHITVVQKLDNELFCRSTRSANEVLL